MPSAVQDDSFIRSEKPVRTNPAALVKSARREINVVESHGIGIESCLARDLTKITS